MNKKGKSVRKNLDAALSGNEPFIEKVEGRDDPKLTRVFNYYNYLHDDKQSQTWLLQWMKQQRYPKDQIDVVRSAPAWASGLTAGWVARMHMNGTEFAEENLRYVRDKIEFVVGRYSGSDEESGPEPSGSVDLQARIKNKNSAVMALAEEQVVDAYLDDPESALGMYDFLIKHTVSSHAASQMRTFYKPQYEEVFDPDPQVKEAYGKRLKEFQKFWTGVMDDLDRYLNNKRVVRVRKPRAAKVKPASKMVEKLQYQKEFGPLKLVSVDPQHIIGAKELWTYNTKYRVLTAYHAEGSEGLGVRGTTLTGWAPTSTGKRLRKPEQVVGGVLTAGKVAIKQILPSLKTADIKPNGRCNQDTVLLRVIR